MQRAPDRTIAAPDELAAVEALELAEGRADADGYVACRLQGEGWVELRVFHPAELEGPGLEVLPVEQWPPVAVVRWTWGA